jgi:hypothetical protein
MSIYSRIADQGEEQGHCKGCRWWQAEHEDAVHDNEALGLCMHQELTHFSLQVTGHSGCNRFEPAKVLEYAGANL